MRVISLLPSATESICLAGGRDLLVGRSHECDVPAGLDGIPVLTEPRCAFEPEQGLDAAAVDQAVSSALAEGVGASLYALDVERLKALEPDLIVTQDLCDVCSIDLNTVRAAAAEMEREGLRKPEILSLNPETLAEVLDDLFRIGDALQAGGDGSVDFVRTARDAAVQLRGRLFRAEEYVNAYVEGPVVGFMEWTDPIFVAGHWSVEMIERAGGRHPLNETVSRPTDGAAMGPQRGARRAGKSIRVANEVFAATNPDVIVVAPCGLTLDQAEAETRKLLEQEWFRALPAVRNGRVVAVDGNQMFNRPGPRLVDAFAWLVGWLNDRPELIPDGFPARVIE